MIEDWLDIKEEDHGKGKFLHMLQEKAGGRVVAKADLIARVRAHYDDPQNIADDIAAMGFVEAADILRERLPNDLKVQSGEVGEILATEITEHQTGFRIPVRRLRYKDGRNNPMQGDDFLGIMEVNGEITYLKGEAKSGKSMLPSVIVKARAQLSENRGQPTAISLIFVTDRLKEGNEVDKKLARRIRNEGRSRPISAHKITHALFTFCDNDRQAELVNDLKEAGGGHGHLSMNLQIDDHQQFISWIYEEVENLGKH